VKAEGGEGKLRFKSSVKPTATGATVTEISKGTYEITIKKGIDYRVGYKG
jgi:hypothetical protein